VRITEAGPDGQTSFLIALTAVPASSTFFLQNTMNVKNLIAAVAVFAAAGSAFAQQTEFVAPDAGFQSSLTRAEVRQDLAQAASEGAIAQRQHDGQDTVYAAGSRNRQDVRAEAIRAASNRHYGDVNDTYFGG
jgi:hypothetical protein